MGGGGYVNASAHQPPNIYEQIKMSSKDMVPLSYHCVYILYIYIFIYIYPTTVLFAI